MLKNTTIGRKDVRITIKSPSSSKHPVTNHPVITYNNLAVVWAERLGPASNERIEAKQQVAINTGRYRVRWSRILANGLNETCIITDGADAFNIRGIEEIGRNSEFLITAEKRDNGQ
jgi:head-tail adaptor